MVVAFLIARDIIYFFSFLILFNEIKIFVCIVYVSLFAIIEILFTKYNLQLQIEYKYNNQQQVFSYYYLFSNFVMIIFTNELIMVMFHNGQTLKIVTLSARWIDICCLYRK